MSDGKMQKHGKRALRTYNRDGEQNYGGGVGDNGKKSGHKQNRAQVCQENYPQSVRERNQVGIIVAVEVIGVPSPQCCRSNDGQRVYDDIIIIRYCHGVWITLYTAYMV